METRTRGDLDPSFHDLTEPISVKTFIKWPLPAARDDEAGRAARRAQTDLLRPIGAEYMHITSNRRETLIQQRIELVARPLAPTRKTLLNELTAAEGRETLSGCQIPGCETLRSRGDALIPMLKERWFAMWVTAAPREVVLGWRTAVA